MRRKILVLGSQLLLIGTIVALLTRSWGPQAIEAQSGSIEAHLFYGMNVFAEPTHAPAAGWGWQAWMPAGFQWVKLWERLNVDVADIPADLPYKVLYTIDCDGFPDDLEAWGDHVQDIATQGQGLVEAYEIANEPNAYWGYEDDRDSDPNPLEYFLVLQEAYTRIKAVDPEAIVVVSGLAPVGRVQGNCFGYDGNNCNAMDELEFWRALFDLGGGDYFDVLGLHPYGFKYEPETDPYSVSNNFCFRGAELQYAILQEYGLGDKPVWATEFSWFRAASEDGEYPGWCSCCNQEYSDTVKWLEVSEEEQADYLVRAFEYAHENWPWMHGMFLWNLDWYDHGWLCEPSRYYSIMKVDYSGGWDPQQDDHTWHPGFSDAHEAVGDMEKHPAEPRPRLLLRPGKFTMATAVSETLALTISIQVDNPWYYSLDWTATADAGQQITPTLLTASGSQDSSLVFSLSSTQYTAGTYSGGITITATPSDTVDSPYYLALTHLVWPEIHRLYLPAIHNRHRP